MDVGVVREIKDGETRVSLTPEGAGRLSEAGHRVMVEGSAGLLSGFSNDDYRSAGASIVGPDEAWGSDLVVKVKEPVKEEYGLLKDQILFTYLHLAGSETGELTEALLKGGTAAIAYETVRGARGDLPLLAPMSAVAGNMAISAGSNYLNKSAGGSGAQLGTVMGEKYGNVVIIGDGVVGRHAARAASNSNVFVIGKYGENFDRIGKEVPEARRLFSSEGSIAYKVKEADLVVGAVLLPGSKAPRVVTEDMVKTMQPGSVIVDVSIDQGGCIETAAATTHSNPVFEKHGVIHYCVANMPAAYPKTATRALGIATLPYVMRLADEGLKALKADRGFAAGLNTYEGSIACRPVSEDLKMTDRYRDLGEILKGL